MDASGRSHWIAVSHRINKIKIEKYDCTSGDYRIYTLILYTHVVNTEMMPRKKERINELWKMVKWKFIRQPYVDLSVIEAIFGVIHNTEHTFFLP